MYLVRVFKNYGPFDFTYETYEEAIKNLKDKWFSCGVWDIRLYKDDEEIEIGELVKSWGIRPVYC